MLSEAKHLLFAKSGAGYATPKGSVAYRLVSVVSRKFAT